MNGCEALALSVPQSSQGLSQAFHPHLLLVQWEIHVRKREWTAACNTAQALIAALPKEPIGWIYRAFTLQQLGRVQEARDVLLAAARRFPADWRIAFNLASYASQLGDRAGAWNWLDRAAELGDTETVKALALGDPGFQALQPALAQNSGGKNESVSELRSE